MRGVPITSRHKVTHLRRLQATVGEPHDLQLPDKMNDTPYFSPES